MKPVTETSNDITKYIDTSSSTGIVQLLKQCDSEIFHGWQGSEGLLNSKFLQNMTDVAQIAQRLMQEEDNCSVILSGCGTSGRLAFITARNFNKQLIQLGHKPCFEYLIAGGDIALFTSQESPEDNPSLGKSELEQASVGKKLVLYIGITCGFSAAYVAGQLDYCMDNLDRFIPVLLGFNPVSSARSLSIENWGKTFHDVAKRLQELSVEGKGFILNPIVGPEPITGSTRMKGGTATKIALETIFTSALCPARDKNVQPSFLKQLIQCYQLTCEAVYDESESLGKLIESGSESLQKGGRVCYVSSGSAGVMCLIDAAECPPTFGADVEEVRGYLEGGYSSLHNKEGDISAEFQVSTTHFLEDILPSLTEKNLIVFLHLGEVMDFPLTPAKVSSVHFGSSTQRHLVKDLTTADVNVYIALPNSETALHEPHLAKFQQYLQKEMATKWLCNCLTTGSYARSGKVFHNYMIDVRVRNNKLFHRAAGIVQTFCCCGKERAYELLMKSIYETDTLPEHYHTLPISTHVEKATPMDKVVPVALVLGLADCSVHEAQKILKETPVVRTAIAKFTK